MTSATTGQLSKLDIWMVEQLYVRRKLSRHEGALRRQQSIVNEERLGDRFTVAPIKARIAISTPFGLLLLLLFKLCPPSPRGFLEAAFRRHGGIRRTHLATATRNTPGRQVHRRTNQGENSPSAPFGLYCYCYLNFVPPTNRIP